MTYGIRNPDRLNGGAIIPPMTHPLSKHWNQPDRSLIILDDKYALMSKEVFDKLHEYSTSIPTGVYEGKMWKAQKWIWEGDEIAIERGWAIRKFLDEWFLRWYGLSNRPGYCSTNQREILLV